MGKREVKKYRVKKDKYGLGLDTRYEEQCYEHFRLMWMASNGFTIPDLIQELSILIQKQIEFYGPEMPIGMLPNLKLEFLFDFWEIHHKFGGKIWPNFYDFIQHEYHDYGYADRKNRKEGANLEQCSLHDEQRHSPGNASGESSVHEPDGHDDSCG